MNQKLHQPEMTKEPRSQHEEHAQRVAELIQSWLNDTSGYDEWAWPIIIRDIEENRLSYRPRFGDEHEID